MMDNQIGTHPLTPLALTTPAVMALCDGQFLLEHLHVLRAVALEPYCRHCAAIGLPATVSVVMRPDEVMFRCQHTSGWIKRNQPLEVQPLLTALGWNIRCTKCQQSVEGDNGKTDASFLVTCPCSVRAMPNPLAQSTATPTGVSRVAELGRAERV